MVRRIEDVSLENLARLPEDVLTALFWELAEDEAPVDPRFLKEEWFSSTLLEWGPCGKLLFDEGEVVAFAEYAPAALFPRLGKYRCGRVSADAVYLSYCYVAPDRRGRKLGTEMIRAVARELVGRGYRALEALGEREWTGGWILPCGFLTANRFTVIREDHEIPLMRLDLRRVPVPQDEEAVVALPLPT